MQWSGFVGRYGHSSQCSGSVQADAAPSRLGDCGFTSSVLLVILKIRGRYEPLYVKGRTRSVLWRDSWEFCSQSRGGGGSGRERERERERRREINLVRDLSSPELNSMRHLHSHKVNPKCWPLEYRCVDRSRYRVFQTTFNSDLKMFQKISVPWKNVFNISLLSYSGRTVELMWNALNPFIACFYLRKYVLIWWDLSRERWREGRFTNFHEHFRISPFICVFVLEGILRTEFNWISTKHIIINIYGR